MAQSQISRTLGGEAARSRIVAMLSRGESASRRALGRRVCEEFAFVDATGRLQVASCVAALASLAARDRRIVLPAPSGRAPDSRPRLCETPVPAPLLVPGVVSQIGEIEIRRVVAPVDRSVWNTLMAHEHPHGMTTFAGCQVRYLVASSHGWLGAAGFSAAALKVAARDRWMAWSDAQRRAHLNRVIGLSRFLIRPAVTCRHLASHVLGRMLRRVPVDFEERYGFRPWLVESFADEGYAGTCLRAANFLCVGQTQGRGRQDRHKRCAKTVKTVFMFPLERRWRHVLGVGHVALHPVLGPGEGLSLQEWAQNEFGGAELGDRRRTQRLVRSAGLLAAYPGGQDQCQFGQRHVGDQRVLPAD